MQKEQESDETRINTNNHDTGVQFTLTHNFAKECSDELYNQR